MNSLRYKIKTKYFQFLLYVLTLNWRNKYTLVRRLNHYKYIWYKKDTYIIEFDSKLSRFSADLIESFSLNE